MTVRNPVLLAAVIVIFITGCTTTTWQVDKSQPVTPRSYSVYQSPAERSMGKLRRIFLLNVTVPTPKACGGNTIRQPPRSAGTEYLHEEKGYDVIEPTKPGDALSGAESPAIVQLIAAAENAGKSGAVPVPAVLTQLLPDQKIDALMLVESTWSCYNARPEIRWSMALMTLGINELLPETQHQTAMRYYRATLFESASGLPVWQVSILGPGNPDLFEVELFHGLEQAVPALLTQ